MKASGAKGDEQKKKVAPLREPYIFKYFILLNIETSKFCVHVVTGLSVYDLVPSIFKSETKPKP